MLSNYLDLVRIVAQDGIHFKVSEFLVGEVRVIQTPLRPSGMEPHTRLVQGFLDGFWCRLALSPPSKHNTS